MQKFILSIFVGLLLTLNASFAEANLSCDFIFTTLPQDESAEAIGDSDHNLRPMGQVFSLRQSRVQDQCATSECYLFAFVGMLETSNLNLRPQLNAPAVSAPYLFARKMIDWAGEKAWYRNENQTTQSLKGGFYSSALLMSRNYGLAPVESWRPKVEFESWDFAKLYNDVQAVASRAEKQVYGNFITRWFQGRDQAAREQRYRDALPLIRESVEKWTGPLPEQVNFRGQKLTTKELEALYGVGHQEHLMMLYPENTANYHIATLEKGLNNAVQAFGGTWSYSPASVNSIHNKIKTWVDAGAPVMLEMQWNDSGHAMFVVGYEKDASGGVRLWKLQNSWGDEWSDQGFGWYEPQDVYQNLWGAYFRGQKSNP